MKTLRYLSGSADKRQNQFVLCMISITLMQSVFLVDNKIKGSFIKKESAGTSEFLIDAATKESIPDQNISGPEQFVPDTTKILDEIPGNIEDTTGIDPFTAPFMCNVWPGYYTFSVLMNGKDEALGIPIDREFADQAGALNPAENQERGLKTQIPPVIEEQELNADTTLPDTVKDYPVLTI